MVLSDRQHKGYCSLQSWLVLHQQKEYPRRNTHGSILVLSVSKARDEKSSSLDNSRAVDSYGENRKQVQECSSPVPA
jgi:hypothetical protein